MPAPGYRCGLAPRCSATGPLIPLTGLLGLLLVAPRARPARHPSPQTGSGATFRAAVPLAILAGCQTLAMLTGGIDLSVGAIASMAGVRRGDAVSDQGPASRSPSRSSRPALAGLVNGIGVGVFKVHPLIMTLGMGLVVLGLTTSGSSSGSRPAAGVPPSSARSAPSRRSTVLPEQPDRVRAGRRCSSCSGSGGPATAGCSTPSATTPSPRGCPASGSGRCSSSLYLISARARRHRRAPDRRA